MQVRHESQTGFSIVELMVGLAIGMMALLVIMQVNAVFGNQQQLTSSNANTLINGGVALYRIERELQLAGYPLMPSANSPLECTMLTYGDTGITSIDPVSIINGGSSDSILVRYGNSQQGGVPTVIEATGSPTANDVTLRNNFGCQTGDHAIVVNGVTCALTSVTSMSAAGVTETVELNNMTATTPGAELACLGNWGTVSYQVNNGNLERNGVPIVSGVVSLQAQYGISATASSNRVAQWVDASGATWAVPTIANRNRIKSVRIAVVVRSNKPENSAVTTACSSTTDAAPDGLCAWPGSAGSPAPVIDLSTDDDWARYRYQVYETIIPLRNVILSKDTL